MTVAISQNLDRAQKPMPRRAWAWIALLALSIFCAPALAQTSQPARDLDNKTVSRTATTKPAAASPAAFDWQRLAVAMAVVLTLIFVLKFVAGRAFPSLSAGRASRAVRVLSRSPLSPKQQLMLVQVGRRVLVIGDSAGELSPLSEITDPDEVASLLGQLENVDSAAEPKRPFASLFGRAREAYAEPAPPAEVSRRFADDNVEALPAGEELEQTQTEISGLIDRMRSLTKTMRQ